MGEGRSCETCSDGNGVGGCRLAIPDFTPDLQCWSPSPADLQKENDQLRAQLRVLAEASSTFLHLHRNLMKTHNSWGVFQAGNRLQEVLDQTTVLGRPIRSGNVLPKEEANGQKI